MSVVDGVHTPARAARAEVARIADRLVRAQGQLAPAAPLPHPYARRSPVELSFRRSAASTAGATLSQAPAERHNTRASEARAFDPVRPEAPTPANALARSAAVALDPAAVDRLTDDIVHRIERRARIERERRGL